MYEKNGNGHDLELPINLHQYFMIHILQEVGVELKVSIYSPLTLNCTQSTIHKWIHDSISPLGIPNRVLRQGQEGELAFNIEF